MIKNTAGQNIGAQMVTAANGTAFTGTVTVYYTLDGGSQTLGSVGSGVCTHEGNGYHTYTPSAGETNGNLCSYTFIGTGAVPVTVQVFTINQQAIRDAMVFAPTPALLPAADGSVDWLLSILERDVQYGTNTAGLAQCGGWPSLPGNLDVVGSVPTSCSIGLNAICNESARDVEFATKTADVDGLVVDDNVFPLGENLYLMVDIRAYADPVPELFFRLAVTEHLNSNKLHSVVFKSFPVAAGNRLRFLAMNDGTIRPYNTADIQLYPWSFLNATESTPGAIEAAFSGIAAAVRDVDNSTPAVGSLGEAVNNGGGGIGSSGLTEQQTQDALFIALGEYDVSHSLSAFAGTTLTVGGLVGEAAVVGPRQPRLVSELFDSVREPLRDINKNMYPDSLMTRYYNRAVTECWSLMTQVGAEVAMNSGTIVADGLGADYELPSDFRAFVQRKVLPRDPVTATADFSWGSPLDHVGLFDRKLRGAPSTPAPPSAFCVFTSGNSQYIRFSSIPPAGEKYDFQYYPEPKVVTSGNIGTTYTPWLGLLDTLLARILEEFAREGLEFITQKRDMWRAKAEADIVALLGLRHLLELEHDPSMWRGFPG